MVNQDQSHSFTDAPHKPSPGPAPILPQVGKLAVGFFAGACAVYLPRLIAWLATPHKVGNSDVVFAQFFDLDYLLVAIAFSAFVGVSVMLLKWQDKCEPSVIFMAALSVPAIVAGGLNMADPVRTADQLSNQVSALSKLVNIPIQSGTQTLTIEPTGSGDNSKLPNSSFLYFVTPAFAQGTKTLQASPSFNPGVFREKQYAVALNSYPSSDAAQKDLGKIRREAAPHAVVVRGSSSYYIIESKNTHNLAAATSEAYQIRNKLKRLGIAASVSLIPLSQ